MSVLSTPLRAFVRSYLPIRRTMATVSANAANFKAADLNRIVWVDCEMTGLDPSVDTLLEIAVIVTDGNLEPLSDGIDLIIHHPDTVLDNMSEWCIEHHGKSGLTAAVRKSKVGMKECEEQVLDLLKTLTPPGKCPLGGNSVGQDAKFLSKYMPELMRHLHYRVIDVSTVKELACRWNPSLIEAAPKKKLTHRALDDIKESIEELKFYREHFFK